MNDEVSQIIFKHLNKAHHWQSKAGKLKHCADLLFKAYLEAGKLSGEEQAETQNSEIDDVATLLYGMAMEDILKATLLKDGIAKIKDDGTVDWVADGAGDHDLLGICSLIAHVKLTDGQKILMKRLSAFVCWAGKYPTPKSRTRKKDFQGFQLLNQPKCAPETMPSAFDAEDKKIFDQIYEDICKEV